MCLYLNKDKFTHDFKIRNMIVCKATWLIAHDFTLYESKLLSKRLHSATTETVSAENDRSYKDGTLHDYTFKETGMKLVNILLSKIKILNLFL